MKTKTNKERFPNDKMVNVMLPCGKIVKKPESVNLMVVHGWTEYEVKVLQESRLQTKPLT